MIALRNDMTTELVESDSTMRTSMERICDSLSIECW